MNPADQSTGGWTPDQQTIDDANVTRFLGWLAETGRGEFADYHALWAASVDDLGWFWDAVWTFFDIQAATPPSATLGSSDMPGAQWFPGATLNYVTQIFRHAVDDRPAMVVAGEDGVDGVVVGAAACRDRGVRGVLAQRRRRPRRSRRRLRAQRR